MTCERRSLKATFSLGLRQQTEFCPNYKRNLYLTLHVPAPPHNRHKRIVTSLPGNIQSGQEFDVVKKPDCSIIGSIDENTGQGVVTATTSQIPSHRLASRRSVARQHITPKLTITGTLFMFCEHHHTSTTASPPRQSIPLDDPKAIIPYSQIVPCCAPHEEYFHTHVPPALSGTKAYCRACDSA